jgi:hypothetical protein
MMRELDGHAPVKQAIVAFRLPYHGHSAFANLSKDAPRSNRLARITCIVRTDVCNGRQNSCKPAAGFMGIACKQSLEFGFQRFILLRKRR